MGCDGAHVGTSPEDPSMWTAPQWNGEVLDFEVVDAPYMRVWEAPPGTRFKAFACECGASILLESDRGWVVSMGGL